MGIKRNILYTSILTTSNYIFPLIVYPYVSRVLGVTNIGLCNFIDSIINYFILFSMMGVTILGTRQIAMDKANSINLSNPFSSLLALNGLTTIFALFILLGVTLTVPELYENRDMMGYGAIKLVSNFLLIEWFYKGIENFRFITVRTIFIKCLFVASVFIFVRDREDYPVYYLLTALTIAGNAIINISYATKFASFRLKLVNLKNYIKPYFVLGSYLVMTSLYTTFNVVYLGFITNDTQVGYYTTATRLYNILLALFTGVTTVLMPRMSNLLAQNKFDEFKSFIGKSTSLLFCFSFPVIIFCTIYAPEVIMLISGPGYEGAITPMRIIMPLMLIIGYEQIQIVQCLMPLKRDKKVMINAGIGALIGIILNFLLIPHLESVGSAITWVSAETTIMVLSQIVLKIEFDINFAWKNFFRELLFNIPLCGILLMIYFIFRSYNYFLVLTLAALITAIYFFSTQIFINKNKTILSLFHK
ncbi:MAG: flippase [Muribaculaceae bacterium]|nr:flippase [Muribaculaceae bacterium]